MAKPRTNQKIYKTQEGLIFLVGVALTIFMLILMAYYLKYDSHIAKTMGLVFLAHTFGGRAAGISLCIMNELNLVWTVLFNFYIEVLIVCFTYSTFIMSIRNHIKLRGVRLFALRLERKARKHKEKIAKYGWVGLFLFVMAPLPVTGPVIGSIIGFLLRQRWWSNFSSVLLGTLAAIVVWSFFFDFLEQHLQIIRYIFAGMIGIVLISYLSTLKAWWSDRK